MGGCAVEGGCPSDYIAVAISLLSLILFLCSALVMNVMSTAFIVITAIWLYSWRTRIRHWNQESKYSAFMCNCPTFSACTHRLFTRASAPFLIHRVPLPKGSGFWIPAIQVFASFNFLLSMIIPGGYLDLKKRHWWQSCYFWRVWVEGPLGFGLLLGCRIVQAYQLYYIFVKRRLPLIRSYIFLPLILLPWVATAALIHIKKTLNPRCHVKLQWMIPVVSLHTLYVAALVGFTGAIRHIEFRFRELRELWQGIFVSASSIGIWIVAYILNEIHEEIDWLQVASRFLLLIMASILILAFFSMSSSQPLISQMSLRKREIPEFGRMGRALGIADSGLLSQRDLTPVVDPSEPLDKLLQNRRFRLSFMAFADSCLAGESVHFLDEVYELGRIPTDDTIRRIYMARHIIEKYIIAGATLEVNISHRTRQEILGTLDLTRPDLFNNAINEVMQLMKTNLAEDYWSSMFFMKFKEAAVRSEGHELEQLTSGDFSPRLSSVRGIDDPFHQDQPLKGCSANNADP